MAVLWVTVALSALIGTALRGLGIETTAAANRIALERASWAAEACIAAARATLDSAARTRAPLAPPDSFAVTLANGSQCALVGHETEEHLNPDSVPADLVANLDSVLRESSGLALDSLLTHDGSGRVDVNAAPWQVLAVLPGVGGRGAHAIIAARRWRRRLNGFSEFLTALPADTRDSVLLNQRRLERLVAFTPSSLILTARGWSARAPPQVALEVVVSPAGDRLAVVRRRVW